MIWEYDSFAEKIDDQGKFLQSLTSAGEERWELVSTQVIGTHIWAFVKRPKL